jgi:hypothetical protein
MILQFVFDQYNSHIAFLIVFFPLNPITSFMGSYHDTMQLLIVAEDNNPPVKTTDTTTIVVMV